MSGTVGPREKAILCQTLAPFLRGLVGIETVVELNNENEVRGVVVDADCFMNLTMKDATLISPSRGTIGKFHTFFMQKSSVRMIRIPTSLNTSHVLQTQLDIATGARNLKNMKAARNRRSRYLQWRESKRQVV